MGGRGSASGRAGGGGVYKTEPTDITAAPIGTRLEFGGWKYTKTAANTWRTTNPRGKRAANRTDADLKRVFS